jgi:Tfp pilus assembly protein PilN
MTQINFFTPFLSKNRYASPKVNRLIISLVIILVVGSLIVIQGLIFLLNVGVNDKESLLNSNAEILREVQETKSKMAILNNTQQIITGLDGAIEGADFIRYQLIEKINSTVPQNLYFQQLTITRTNWTLTGYANTRIAIAEFQSNLKTQKVADKVDVKNITYENNVYTFSVEGTFGQEAVEHENK